MFEINLKYQLLRKLKKASPFPQETLYRLLLSECCLTTIQVVGIHYLTLLYTLLEYEYDFKCSLELFYLGPTFK